MYVYAVISPCVFTCIQPDFHMLFIELNSNCEGETQERNTHTHTRGDECARTHLVIVVASRQHNGVGPLTLPAVDACHVGPVHTRLADLGGGGKTVTALVEPPITRVKGTAG